MIIVIAGKQSACPSGKQKDSRRVSNLVLTAHAGTFIGPSDCAGNACVPHLGATENWTIEQLALMHALVRFAHICTEAIHTCFGFGPAIVEMSSGFPSIHSPLRAFFLIFEQKGSG